MAALVVTLVACGGGDDDDGDSTAAESSDIGVDDAAAETADETSDDTDMADDTEPGDDTDTGDDTEPDADDAQDESTGDGGAPEVDSGVVTVGGETSELTGPSRSEAMLDADLGLDPAGPDFDFEICETVNPAFAGDFNISGTLADGTPFRLSGNVDEDFDDIDGLFLGDTFEEERAEGTEVSIDDRTLSGSAATSRGDVEFTFTC